MWCKAKVFGLLMYYIDIKKIIIEVMAGGAIVCIFRFAIATFEVVRENICCITMTRIDRLYLMV